MASNRKVPGRSGWVLCALGWGGVLAALWFGRFGGISDRVLVAALVGVFGLFAAGSPRARAFLGGNPASCSLGLALQ